MNCCFFSRRLASCSVPSKGIKTATLNYSGMIASPYQYYENEDQYEKKISRIFSQVVTEKYEDFLDDQKFKWNMGSMDLRWPKRYTPIKYLRCGVNDKNRMMNEQQFLREWDKKREEDEQQLTEQYFKGKYKQSELQEKIDTQFKNTRDFDLACYKTFIQLIYGISDISALNVKADKYIKAREKDFKKPYLDETKKLNLTLQLILSENFCIFCLQESNKQLRHQLKTNKKIKNLYFIRESLRQCEDSLILINKKVFPHTEFEMANTLFIKQYAKKRQIGQEQLLQKLNFNKDSVFQVLNQHMIIFSVHLSSKSEKNELQKKDLIQEISNIKKYMPRYAVTIAGDLNAPILKEQIVVKMDSNEIQMVIYPADKQEFTSHKKRTLIQPQRHKANVLNSTAKDYIISDSSIANSFIGEIINGKLKIPKRTSLLPTSDHPYDHYLVCSEILMP